MAYKAFAQNEIQPRIEEYTPMLRTQYVFSGREAAVKENNKRHSNDLPGSLFVLESQDDITGHNWRAIATSQYGIKTRS